MPTVDVISNWHSDGLTEFLAVSSSVLNLDVTVTFDAWGLVRNFSTELARSVAYALNDYAKR